MVQGGTYVDESAISVAFEFTPTLKVEAVIAREAPAVSIASGNKKGAGKGLTQP